VKTIVPIVKNQENWLILFLGSLAVYFFIKTFGYRPAAALFPRIVSAIVALLAFYHLAENIWKAFHKQPEEERTVTGLPICLHWYRSLALVLLYLLLIYLAGFVLATGLFMIYFPIAAGYRRWPVIVVTAVATALLIDLSFNRLLQIQLHEGILFTIFQQ